MPTDQSLDRELRSRPGSLPSPAILLRVRQPTGRRVPVLRQGQDWELPPSLRVLEVRLALDSRDMACPRRVGSSVLLGMRRQGTPRKAAVRQLADKRYRDNRGPGYPGCRVNPEPGLASPQRGHHLRVGHRPGQGLLSLVRRAGRPVRCPARQGSVRYPPSPKAAEAV